MSLIQKYKDEVLNYEGVHVLWEKIKFHVKNVADTKVDNETFEEEFKNKLGVPNGIATLTDAGTIPSSQLPSYVDDVVEYPTLEEFPEVGENGKIYVALDTNKTYRWGETTYVIISDTLAIGETAYSAFAGNRGKILETIVDNISKSDIITTNFSHAESESDKIKLSFNEHKLDINTGELKKLVNSYNYIEAAKATKNKGQIPHLAGAMSGEDKDFIEFLKGKSETENYNIPKNGNVLTYNSSNNSVEWAEPSEDAAFCIGTVHIEDLRTNIFYCEDYVNDEGTIANKEELLNKKITIEDFNFPEFKSDFGGIKYIYINVIQNSDEGTVYVDKIKGELIQVYGLTLGCILYDVAPIYDDEKLNRLHFLSFIEDNEVCIQSINVVNFIGANTIMCSNNKFPHIAYFANNNFIVDTFNNFLIELACLKFKVFDQLIIEENENINSPISEGNIYVVHLDNTVFMYGNDTILHGMAYSNNKIYDVKIYDYHKEIDYEIKEISILSEEDIRTLVSTKVDKIEGKGLSTNDFTDELKDKLESIDYLGDSHCLGDIVLSIDNNYNIPLASDFNDKTDAIFNNKIYLVNYNYPEFKDEEESKNIHIRAIIDGHADTALRGTLYKSYDGNGIKIYGFIEYIFNSNLVLVSIACCKDYIYLINTDIYIANRSKKFENNKYCIFETAINKFNKIKKIIKHGDDSSVSIDSTSIIDAMIDNDRNILPMFNNLMVSFLYNNLNYTILLHKIDSQNIFVNNTNNIITTLYTDYSGDGSYKMTTVDNSTGIVNENPKGYYEVNHIKEPFNSNNASSYNYNTCITGTVYDTKTKYQRWNIIIKYNNEYIRLYCGHVGIVFGFDGKNLYNLKFNMADGKNFITKIGTVENNNLTIKTYYHNNDIVIDTIALGYNNGSYNAFPVRFYLIYEFFNLYNIKINETIIDINSTKYHLDINGGRICQYYPVDDAGVENNVYTTTLCRLGYYKENNNIGNVSYNNFQFMKLMKIGDIKEIENAEPNQILSIDGNKRIKWIDAPESSPIVELSSIEFEDITKENKFYIVND